jgi:hypothetical protein
VEKKMLALLLFLVGCGNIDDGVDAVEAAQGSFMQHWTATGAATPAGCAPSFADIPATANDCTGVPTRRTDSPLGEVSVGCFGSVGAIRVAVGMRGCSAEYRVTFSP